VNNDTADSSADVMTYVLDPSIPVFYVSVHQPYWLWGRHPPCHIEDEAGADADGRTVRPGKGGSRWLVSA